MARLVGMVQQDRGAVDPLQEASIARALADGFVIFPLPPVGLMIEGWDGVAARVIRTTPTGVILVSQSTSVTNLANTIVPLAPAGVFVGPVVQVNDPTLGSLGSNLCDGFAVLSGGGTLDLQVSKDGVTFYTQQQVIVIAGVPSFVSELRFGGVFARAVLTDGGAGSAVVVLHLDLRST